MTSLHRIEALPGAGRYAVTFRDNDGSEQTAVVHADATGLEVADANLPTDWSRSAPAFAALQAVLTAMNTARESGPPTMELVDIDGGWDVMVGNVVLLSGVPHCVAHGSMAPDDGVFACPECGARAVLTGRTD